MGILIYNVANLKNNMRLGENINDTKTCDVADFRRLGI